MREDMKVL